MWLAMGGTINHPSNVQIRFDHATVRPGMFLRALRAALLPPDLSLLVKNPNTKFEPDADGVLADAGAPTEDELYEQCQTSQDEEVKHFGALLAE